MSKDLSSSSEELCKFSRRLNTVCRGMKRKEEIKRYSNSNRS